MCELEGEREKERERSQRRERGSVKMVERGGGGSPRRNRGFDGIRFLFDQRYHLQGPQSA